MQGNNRNVGKIKEERRMGIQNAELRIQNGKQEEKKKIRNQKRNNQKFKILKQKINTD